MFLISSVLGGMSEQSICTYLAYFLEVIPTPNDEVFRDAVSKLFYDLSCFFNVMMSLGNLKGAEGEVINSLSLPIGASSTVKVLKLIEFSSFLFWMVLFLSLWFLWMIWEDNSSFYCTSFNLE